MWNPRVELALAKAAARVLGREPTELEKRRLYKSFQQASGTVQIRATRALSEGTGKTVDSIQVQRSHDDNLDRTMNDIENILGG